MCTTQHGPTVTACLVLVLLGSSVSALTLPALPAAPTFLARAAEEKPRCPTVFLGYRPGEAVAFYNEVTIDKSADGTSFVVCGSYRGSLGLEQRVTGKKVVAFAFFEDEGLKLPEAKKGVRILKKDPKAVEAVFPEVAPPHDDADNQCTLYLPYDWKLGEIYRFLVTARVDENGEKRTEYAGYFYVPEDKAWRHLATYSTGGGYLRSHSSFVEDPKKDPDSTRRARFGNGWVRTKDGPYFDGEWVALTQARFFRDGREKGTNLDAGVDGERFFLATGGQTNNTGTKLHGIVTLTPDPKNKRTPPEGLPGAVPE